MIVQKNVKSRSAARSTSSTQASLYFTLKRALDIIVSLLVLIFLVPVFMIISYWIYKKEGKPIYFRQLRMGKDNRPFIMWTFRTMTNPSQVIRTLPPHPVPSTWENGVPNDFSLKTNGHTTITNTGNFLLKYSLYKLPQFVHVLKGEMSLVGPKAELPVITKYYNDVQVRRQIVRPGMTGYAQINHFSNRGYEQMIADDIYYIHHCSYRLDMKIIFQTIKQIIQIEKVN